MNVKYTTIIGPGKLLSQGILIEELQDGKITIQIFDKLLTGLSASHKR